MLKKPHICIIYIVVKTIEFGKDKVLNIVNVELLQLGLHILLHIVTLCFTYADDDDYLQTCLKIIVVIGVCEKVSQRAEVLHIYANMYLNIYTKIWPIYIYIFTHSYFIFIYICIYNLFIKYIYMHLTYMSKLH